MFVAPRRSRGAPLERSGTPDVRRGRRSRGAPLERAHDARTFVAAAAASWRSSG